MEKVLFKSITDSDLSSYYINRKADGSLSIETTSNDYFAKKLEEYDWNTNIYSLNRDLFFESYLKNTKTYYQNNGILAIYLQDKEVVVIYDLLKGSNSSFSDVKNSFSDIIKEYSARHAEALHHHIFSIEDSKVIPSLVSTGDDLIFVDADYLTGYTRQEDGTFKSNTSGTLPDIMSVGVLKKGYHGITTTGTANASIEESGDEYDIFSVSGTGIIEIW